MGNKAEKTITPKEVIKSVKPGNSLSAGFLRMTIFPLIFLAIVVTLVASNLVSRSLQREIHRELSNAADFVETTYDQMYPGDYKIVGTNTLAFMKGDTVLSGHRELISGYKEKTDLDITIFYQDARVLTTISSDGVQTIEETGAHSKIVHDVIQENHEAFYTNVDINGAIYYCYYRPLYNSDGSTFGMIGIAKPRSDVQTTVWSVIEPIILIALISLVGAAYFSMRNSRKMLFAIRKTELFLEQVAQGNLSATLDKRVSNRKDELGKMGNAAVIMESSLRELVEQDVLTGLYNRRFGNKKLKDLWAKAGMTGMKYAIAIADIDFFKKVNDTYGHECGDMVLKAVSAIFKREMPKKGTVIRWGGEEFLFIFEDMDSKEAAGFLKEITDQVRELETVYGNQTVRVTLTCGVTDGDNDHSIDDIVSDADLKLYQGKQNGRDQIVL